MRRMMPDLFIGHGNPMNAISDNRYRQAWLDLGRRLPRPQAVLCVSAHWETPRPMVCNAKLPRTIHDFSGFPAALYAAHYPAPGAPQLAQRIQQLIGAADLEMTADWGLDHGAWCVLQSLFPAADVPVCQLSLARGLSLAGHLALAQQLATLRSEGVMLLGSGNIVHNLRQLGAGPVPDWARDFDQGIKQALDTRDDARLLDYAKLPGAAVAVPTAEHFLPLLYVAGARQADDHIDYVVEGFDLGSLSMRSVLYTPPGRA